MTGTDDKNIDNSAQKDDSQNADNVNPTGEQQKDGAADSQVDKASANDAAAKQRLNQKLKNQEAKIAALEAQLAKAGKPDFNAEQEVQDLKLQLARKDVQAEFGLSADDVANLPGDTPDEIRRQAEYWAERLKTSSSSAAGAQDTTTSTLPPQLKTYDSSPEEKKQRLLSELAVGMNKEIKGLV